LFLFLFVGAFLLLFPIDFVNANPFVTGVNEILSAIIKLIGLGIGAAATLLGWVIDVDNYKLLKSSAIENSWKVIRDILNLAFILVLLFSAFATIFQIEKYHLKKILLTLVIMALLINFSLPISRFVIDAANIPMYYIATIIFGGGSGSISSAIGESSTIGSMFQPMLDTSQGSPMEYLAAIIFSFIFLITLFALAFMFLIRLVVLIILCIFSPLGFAAAILPSTQNYANDYWHTLFKNAFFGPIMLLMLAISIYILKAFQTDRLLALAQTNSINPDNANTLALWAFYFVPVVMLWGGMIWAQKLGAVGASVVMNKADSFARKPFDKTWGWTVGGGKAIVGGTGALAGAGISRIPYLRGLQAFPAAAKKAWYTNSAEREKKRREDYNEIAAARLPGSRDTARNAQRRIEDRRVSEQIAEDKKIGTSRSTLESRINPAAIARNPVQAKAAALLLAEKKDLRNPDQLMNALQAMNGDSDRMKNIIQNAPGEAIRSLNDTQRSTMQDLLNNRTQQQQFNPQLNATDLNNNIQELTSVFEKKLRDEGRMDLTINARIQQASASGPINEPALRQNMLDGLDNTTIAKQGVDFFRDPQIQAYLTSLRTSNPERINELLSRQLSQEKIRAAGLL